MGRWTRVPPHRAIGDVPPIRRFELAQQGSFEVLDGEIEIQPEVESPKKFITRRVDDKGRILILNHRYHVGRYLAGQSVTIAVDNGMLNVAHNGVVVATHARRHKQEDDGRMDRRAKASKPARPTKGDEVLRRVDPKFGALSFAGTSYRVGNRYCGMLAGVRLVGDTVQITIDGQLVRTHKARHDKSKEFGALAQPNGKPRRSSDVP